MSQDDKLLFADRFFERQHGEIMARIERARTARRRRHAVIGLAAAAVVAAAFVGSFLLTGLQEPIEPIDWATTIPVDTLGSVDDPLEAFGLWEAPVEDVALDWLPELEIDTGDEETDLLLGLELETLG